MALGFDGRDFITEYRRGVAEFKLPLKKKIATLSKGIRTINERDLTGVRSREAIAEANC